MQVLSRHVFELRGFDKEYFFAHYKATKFLEMVTMQGGLATAKALLHTPHLPDGFAELWQRGRLDLTMEYMLVQAPWMRLTT